ncbi:hypothetical protein [Paenibacillus profundus]|uniref:hypothetical protein n=1 Tax=Paenibacillus profundus TaxID=1173085 RepID=UPI002D80A36E|nr:hypothetical protein [Paenibacillus profundus]
MQVLCMGPMGWSEAILSHAKMRKGGGVQCHLNLNVHAASRGVQNSQEKDIARSIKQPLRKQYQVGHTLRCTGGAGASIESNTLTNIRYACATNARGERFHYRLM